MDSSILRRFEDPDEVRVFEKGRFEIVHLGGLTTGRASYEPGWKWSEHVAPIAGSALCGVECRPRSLRPRGGSISRWVRHGSLTAGQLFYIPAVPHDSWVVGDASYVSLHFLGADSYTK